VAMAAPWAVKGALEGVTVARVVTMAVTVALEVEAVAGAVTVVLGAVTVAAEVSCKAMAEEAVVVKQTAVTQTTWVLYSRPNNPSRVPTPLLP
jgi:hypothetical protein